MIFEFDINLAADLSDQEIHRYASRLADAVAELLEGRGEQPCRFSLSVDISKKFKALREQARRDRSIRMQSAKFNAGAAN